ncbi:hypothetical protein PENFLA_c051G10194 [Penicillium flavigenum]|uniref:Alpha/beta hydrolase fold-3 domain-containing protein n=1 Tax=Penicillium flavigenum TaxID=254877 RepID=A0A1V6SH39_9EURO|nr:hypothetical protein PENFLA_c051G10194 [Penicillium flavigenum]
MVETYSVRSYAWLYGKPFTKGSGFVSSHSLSENTITLPDGTRAHWIGDPAAEKVLLFFHGGGYLLYPGQGHFQLLHETLRAAEQQGTQLAVLFLSYDISLQAPYPRQLQQASALLKYTLTVLRREPENIFLTGDSAGGNLAIALLSHILHPHPQIEAIHVPTKLGGAALLSPWVTFNTSSGSMRSNQYSDVLNVAALEKWATLFKGLATSDQYMEPLSAPEDWWQGLPTREVLVIAGGDELFVDDIQNFADQLSSVHKEVILETVPREAHDHLVMEFFLKEGRTRQREIFEKWLCRALRK